MKYLILLSLLLFVSCGKQAKAEAKADAAKLDAFLAESQIDSVELLIPFKEPRTLTGAAAQKYVSLLSGTNRIATPMKTKEQVLAGVFLKSGTNVVCELGQFDNGFWEFNTYSFQLRISP